MAERGPSPLIGSNKVDGTAVYGADVEKIGSIERVMIEKTTGKVSCAVLNFGGFPGIGDDHYPLPWSSLKYNGDLGGYQTMVPVDKFKKAPKAAIVIAEMEYRYRSMGTFTQQPRCLAWNSICRQ